MRWIEAMFVPMRHFLTSAWGERTIMQWVANVMLIVHGGLGIAILVGGLGRLTPPSYDPIIDLVNGHIWIWGVWSIVVAVLLVVPLRWPNIIGLVFGMFWMYLWCGLFAIAIAKYPEASATAMVAYGGFALLDLGLLVVRVIDRDEG